MTGHDAALGMQKGVLKVMQLTFTCPTAILANGLSHTEHSPRVSGVAMGQHTAVGVHRQRPPRTGSATGQVIASFPLGTEAQILKLNKERGRKTVIELRETYIPRMQPSLRQCGPARICSR